MTRGAAGCGWRRGCPGATRKAWAAWTGERAIDARWREPSAGRSAATRAGSCWSRSSTRTPTGWGWPTWACTPSTASLNAEPTYLCERVFLPEEPGDEPRVGGIGPSPARLRRGGLLALLRGRLPERPRRCSTAPASRCAPPTATSASRSSSAGGIAVQINPEPVAPFFDLFLVGEGEELCRPFLDLLLEAGGSARPDRPDARCAALAGPAGRLRALALRGRVRRHPRRRRCLGHPLRAAGGRFGAREAASTWRTSARSPPAA